MWPLATSALAGGKTLALPRFNQQTGYYAPCRIEHLDADVAPGQFGIREPAAHCAELSADEIDLVLAPGVAFDRAGWRLGRGRGFYDRLLASISGVKCGVAFDIQIVSDLPVVEHDQRVNFVLTPTEWIKAQSP